MAGGWVSGWDLWCDFHALAQLSLCHEMHVLRQQDSVPVERSICPTRNRPLLPDLFGALASRPTHPPTPENLSSREKCELLKRPDIGGRF